MSIDEITQRAMTTLFNRDCEDGSLGLRGLALLLIALIVMFNWRWDPNEPASYLIAVATPPLFAIGAVMLREAWNKTRPGA